ncbi:hypothetical protein BUALT_Bualt05G0068000 [Buddleja alternifolia]|uniref:Replication factor A C-terminal domain-containing protein n=1 Tax=Buddleja alternifolia TaxID=168488 RepID=A0AAV6XJ46_9LAMI|nr:hypothetical protein BUALT_Bualt05G0068000 [Buddleja alternifolia]
MHRALVPVSEITPSTKNWTAKVLVIQKLNPRQSRAGSKKYQRFLFIDKDETKLQAIAYSPDIDLMQNIPQLLETYYISNAKVTVVDPRFQVVPHMYQWIINRRTAIKHVNDDALPREFGIPHFARFVDILPSEDSDTLVDIIAIVIDKVEQRLVNTRYGVSTVQEFFVINEERMPMMLSLWNNVLFIEGQDLVATSEKMPIIAATRINIVDYNGISLAARGFASIVVNPPYPQTLRDWRSRNHTYLTQLVEEKKYLKRHVSQSIVPQSNYSSIVNAIATITDDKKWIKATAKITDYEQSFWCMGCNKCLGRTTGEYEWNIMCNFYHIETITKLRTRFTITFSDNTAQLDASIFGETAEKILGLSAMELMNKEEKNKVLDCDTINERLNGQQFFAQIRKKEINTRYGIDYRYNVFALVEAEQPSTHSSSHTSSCTSCCIAGSSITINDDAAGSST